MPIVMPFGKHKGKPVSEVPRGYLRWFIAEVKGCPVVHDEAVRVLGDDCIREAAKRPGVFVLPSGKHQGKSLDQLDDASLAGVRNAYNGMGAKYRHVVKLCDTEINRRKTRGQYQPVTLPLSRHNNPRFTYHTSRFRSMHDSGTLEPWPDGFGRIGDAARSEEPPFDLGHARDAAELDAEFRSIFR